MRRTLGTLLAGLTLAVNTAAAVAPVPVALISRSLPTATAAFLAQHVTTQIATHPTQVAVVRIAR